MVICNLHVFCSAMANTLNICLKWEVVLWREVRKYHVHITSHFRLTWISPTLSQCSDPLMLLTRSIQLEQKRENQGPYVSHISWSAPKLKNKFRAPRHQSHREILFLCNHNIYTSLVPVPVRWQDTNQKYLVPCL